ncbi:hypothetical protein [Flavobacterium sp. JP2137]|uniref:hypothetical protein n=1 Tax=Flavobacterium sp. JP2137 TaxID=3414510 RepID=UPI003D300244
MKNTLVYDKIIFYCSALLLILWVLRAAFLQQLYLDNTISLWASKLFVPMVLLLFLLPCLIAFRIYRQKVAIVSYLFASLVFNALTLLTVFLSNR